jgi:hypothetical protein
MSLRKLGALVVLTLSAVSVGPAAGQATYNGDFELGNTAFSSEYAPTTYFCGGNTGSYLITTNPSTVNCYGDWANIGDHTSGSGLMMIIDGSTVAGTIIWSATIPVTPATTYNFTFWGTGVNTNGSVTTSLQVYINGRAHGNPLQIGAYDGSWHEGSVHWKSGTKTQATIWIIDTQLSAGWNDFAIDDLALTLQ